ncbi:hypothetical protein [Ornithinibacillus xuwenensis]|uniref:Uncharacterized protein n=1 Tax=Ornithinibacillus xuwenensis TaxID=3144668 RepID=A0ABU9XEF4_9BACI
MKHFILTVLLLTFLFVSGSLVVTANSISSFNEDNEFADPDLNDEEPDPWY